MIVLKTLGWLLLIWFSFHFCRGFFGSIQDGRRRRANKRRAEEEALEELLEGPPRLRVYWPDASRSKRVSK